MRGLPSAWSPLQSRDTDGPPLGAVAMLTECLLCALQACAAPPAGTSRGLGGRGHRVTAECAPVTPHGDVPSQGVFHSGVQTGVKQRGPVPEAAPRGSGRPETCPAQRWPLMPPDAGRCPLPEPR